MLLKMSRCAHIPWGAHWLRQDHLDMPNLIGRRYTAMLPAALAGTGQSPQISVLNGPQNTRFILPVGKLIAELADAVPAGAVISLLVGVA